MEPVTQGRSSGKTAFPSNAWRGRRESDGNLLALVENLRRLAKICVIGNNPWLGEAGSRMNCAMSARRLLVFHLLQIVGKHNGRHPSFAERSPDSAVNQMSNLCRCRGLLNKRTGDILEHGREIDLLLIVPADCSARLLSGDCQHRHVIKPGVV